MPATVYTLFYDTTDGHDRESWNTFYTPFELFLSKERMNARKIELEEEHEMIEFLELVQVAT